MTKFADFMNYDEKKEMIVRTSGKTGSKTTFLLLVAATQGTGEYLYGTIK